MGATVQRGFIETEGDRLYYEVRGQGTPILMIAAAGGDGDYYHPMADLLADEYKVITYDRRANSRSSMNQPQNFEISQQSRDAAAVLHAAGEQAAIVFGNSSGAVIALDMANTQPQAVLAAIIHEPATPCVHPKARKWAKFFAKCYLFAHRFGSSLGAVRFMGGVRLPLISISKAQARAGAYAKEKRGAEDFPRIPVKVGLDFLMFHELLPVTTYAPDTEAIRRNGVKMVLGAGEWSLKHKAFYAESAQILAERLGAPFVVFPSNHGGYMEDPESFAATMLKAIKLTADHSFPAG